MASASLVNNSFKTPTNFGGDNPEAVASPSSPKTPLISSRIVEMVIESVVNIKY